MLHLERARGVMVFPQGGAGKLERALLPNRNTGRIMIPANHPGGLVNGGGVAGSAGAVTADASVARIEFPRMITMSNGRSITEDEITFGLFRDVMRGYKFTGNRAETLSLFLDIPTVLERSMVLVNLFDAREFVGRLSKLVDLAPGEILRLPKDYEVNTTPGLKGELNHTWTESPYSDSGSFILAHILNSVRSKVAVAGTREPNFSIRVVRELKVA
jgi:hypothetical protein